MGTTILRCHEPAASLGLDHPHPHVPLAPGRQGQLAVLELGGIDHQRLVVDLRIVQARAAAANQTARLALRRREAGALQQVRDVDARGQLGPRDLAGRRCLGPPRPP
jgi:hypothetical protein